MRIFPPFILTAPKPGPTITGVPWCLAQGLLVPGFSCACRRVMGTPSPGQGVQEPGTVQRCRDAPGSIQHIY